MRMRVGKAISLSIAAAAFSGVAVGQEFGKLPDTVERVAASVVAVAVTRPKADPSSPGTAGPPSGSALPPTTDHTVPTSETSTSYASGIVLSADGHVVTTVPSVENATKIEVTFDNGSKVAAKLVGMDARTGIAVIKVPAEKPLTPVTFAAATPLVRRGELVFAIGNPLGLDNSVTLGIVSAAARDTGSGPYDRIQTDALMLKGSSGAGLFNLDGKVVGLGDAITTTEGAGGVFGLAIPADLVARIAGELAKSGRVERAWLGVKIQNVGPDEAKAAGLAGTHGALVAEIPPNSPAVGAGLKVGDIIVAVGEKPVSDSRALARHIADHAPNATVVLDVRRGGTAHKVTVTLGRFQN